jgi:hypothetical protein
LLAKPLIFVVISVLAVTLIYSSFTPFIVFAEPPDTRWISSRDCKTVGSGAQAAVKCCWREKVPGQILGKEYCQTCTIRTGQQASCGPKVAQSITTPPTTGESVLPEGGVAEQPEQPPLFGRNEGAAPPTGGIEQPFTSIPFQQIPQGTVQGQDQPFLQSESPPALTPLPTPPPPSPLPPPTQTGPTVAPQDNQDDEGGGLPTIKNQENVPPGGGVAEQPEDDGQEDSSEGAETAGPLT